MTVIPDGEVGGQNCGPRGDYTVIVTKETVQNWLDFCIFSTTSGATAPTGGPNVGRFVHEASDVFGLSPNDSRIEDGTSPNDYLGDYGFGSHHPGVCQFLLGDGSVRPFRVTMSTTTLWNLARVNDGNAVDF